MLIWYARATLWAVGDALRNQSQLLSGAFPLWLPLCHVDHRYGLYSSIQHTHTSKYNSKFLYSWFLPEILTFESNGEFVYHLWKQRITKDFGVQNESLLCIYINVLKRIISMSVMLPACQRRHTKKNIYMYIYIPCCPSQIWSPCDDQRQEFHLCRYRTKGERLVRNCVNNVRCLTKRIPNLHFQSCRDPYNELRVGMVFSCSCLSSSICSTIAYAKPITNGMVGNMYTLGGNKL